MLLSLSGARTGELYELLHIKKWLLLRTVLSKVAVRRWDPSTEDLNEMEEEEAGRLAAGMYYKSCLPAIMLTSMAAVERFEFDQFLGPYPVDSLDKWQSLSCFITK